MDARLISIELPELLRALRRRYWIPIASVVTLGLIVCVAAMREPKMYRGVASLIIEPVMPKVLGHEFDVDDFDARAGAAQDFHNTQYNIMRSRAVLREALA